MSHPSNPQRNALLAKIHIAKNQLSIPDNDYRALIGNLTNGKTSCKDCNGDELGIIMDTLVGLGFKASKPKIKLSPKTSADPTQADKIRAMWIDLYHSGVVRNRGDDALQHFVKRLTGVDRVEWLDHQQAVAVIAALTQMGRPANPPPA